MKGGSHVHRDHLSEWRNWTHLGHEWQLGPGGASCSKCGRAQREVTDATPYPCWPPCRDCGLPMLDHNDHPDGDDGPASEVCWRRMVTAGDRCSGRPIDWRARALAAEARVRELEAQIGATRTEKSSRE